MVMSDNDHFRRHDMLEYNYLMLTAEMEIFEFFMVGNELLVCLTLHLTTWEDNIY